ncbi:lipid-A-disaccharide synthase [Dinghuibacter silviterrae]|uniref:Lipid-A-disaccharide synthase n=1 Tax=Dinghuibacter silviterrae TaxID=1539049 RepID=A0A4R8DQX3_9BACT|nr:lipid-A-disaccharide synthase [Dinghuibacter silviterrae]TDX00564.1 lipid-A-disaccharide synthase [Dinghuibacter silviterrae]
MRYYLIAGEASGDLHGSNLIKALKAHDSGAEFRCWGGDMMEAAGAVLVKHYKELAFMGFVEVVRNLPTILRNLRMCKEDVLAYKPDALILVDYPGFNLRIARWAHTQGIRVIYYISPQVWAWKESRVKGIKESVDKMLVILPFEKEFYHKWGYEVEYVGHPLVEVVEAAQRQAADHAGGKPIVALLPGSRAQEVALKLPVMLEVSRAFPDHQFVVAQAPSLDDAYYAPLLQDYPDVQTVRGNTYGLLGQARAALVTSGTATLETALFGVPEVVCYKGSQVSYEIAKRLIKVKYISLVNLIMDKPVVKELIQGDMNAANVRTELEKLLKDEAYRARIMEDYAALKRILQQGGDASANAAASIVRYLSGADSAPA